MINIKYITKRTIPTMLATVTALSTYSCSQKNKKPENINETAAYTLEQYKELPNFYSIKNYNIEKTKGTPYEIKKIGNSYDYICTPKELEKYTEEKNITWKDIKETINNSKFDEYHKSILHKGINNLEKNNFNMSLETLNYNIKNTTIEYVDDLGENNITGAFNCFEHKITLTKKIKDKKKYEQVFLHEILGHGMTEAYIDNSKVYCSINIPTYVTDKNNKFMGYITYGEAFSEAIAQTISLLALDKELCEEYKSAYDIYIVELLMLCKDNNYDIAEYANNGINNLIDKMKNNDIDRPYNLIEMITYNFEFSQHKQEIKMPSEILMYEYFCERINDSFCQGKTKDEINKKMQDIFNYYGEFILTNNVNSEEIVDNSYDYIDLTRLYNEIEKFAYTNKPKQKIK